nr:TetR/AcrR family transcriptional regulator [Microbacterium halotolerans]
MSRAAPGRPRLRPGRAEVEPRQEILEAAASLFAEHGYAATSTRQIADRVGVKQASLYYHFKDKEQILLELLTATVKPTLDRAAEHLAREDPRTALHDLASADVETLLAEPHNIGTMYLSPEISGTVFAPFRAMREELTRIYGSLAQRVNPELDAHFAGSCCIQLVELVIRFRQDGEDLGDLPERIAAACLRLVEPQDPATRAR